MVQTMCTFDGRVFATGSDIDLTITNISTNAAATTIQFTESAETDTIKYCTIKGSGTGTGANMRGILFFSTATTGNGNDKIIIENNNITSDAAGRPINAIYSSGSAGFENSDNIIRNNNIYDFLNRGVASYGINLSAGSSTWTITGNSFYETASLIPTASVAYIIIQINNATGTGFNISDNFIGGQAASCGGSAWTKTNAFNNIFTAISINAGSGIVSSLQNNTISNFNWSNSLNGNWTAINIAAGDVNTGTITGNTIGATTGTGSITLTAATTGAIVYGINILSPGTVDCQKNNIGSITTANIDANASSFYGINNSATAGAITISNNTIGSASTAGSINTSSGSSAAAQTLYGIYNAGTGTVTISGNTISNLTNATNNATIATRGLINGIASVNGENTISDNIIHDLTIANANNSGTSTAAAGGIVLTGATLKTVTGNTIYNISNTYDSFAGTVYGLYFTGNSGANVVSKNFIHSLSVTGAASNAAAIYGIRFVSGEATGSNNIITLAGNTLTTIYGIYDAGGVGNNSNLFFNTVYVGGVNSAGASNKSYALYSAANNNVRDYRNNILSNTRSTEGGSNLHYAAYIVTAGGTITCDYNDYYVSGTGGTLGYYGANRTSLPIVTGQDGCSSAINPLFASAGGTTAADYIPSANTLLAATGTGITTDYDGGAARSTTAPSMGAFEVAVVTYIEIYKTGVLQGGYSYLKGAFDAINAGTVTGALEIRINLSTTENISAVLNASGMGSANYTSVNIYPTVSGITVSGNMATPLIDLNGADNVTIDGRVNATGTTKDMVITNTSIAATAGTSTIRFINDASANTVKYCTIKGSQTGAANGILLFSTAAASGNDGNTIDNNNITSSADTDRPLNVIYSSGTATFDNSGNIISNNYFYDFFNRSTASYGINLGANTTSWDITGNSFFEKASFVPAASVAYNVIFINNASGTGFTISNNFIGGQAASCGGSAWTKTSDYNNIFNAINITAGAGTVSSIQNNTIRNFNWSNSANAAWTAIGVAAGDVNIGTATGNTIGAGTGTGSITVTATTSGAIVYGINILSPGTVDCQKNIIGSVTTANADANATNFYGISNSATAGTITISNNTIGSTTTASSINASSASTAATQTLYGIYNAGTGTVTIGNNTIVNLTNGTTNATGGTNGLVHGINSTNGTNTITGNTIHDLTIASANTNGTTVVSAGGIILTGATLKTVSGNTIYNLSNTNSTFAGSVTGLYFTAGTGANVADKNFIHSLSVPETSSAATIFGIRIASGATTWSNNIISITGNSATTIYGIYETGAAGNDNSLYFNTVYIGGSLTLGSANRSYCLYSASTANIRDFRNNIFRNARSTDSGSNLHYAAYIANAGGTITCDFNDYRVSGTGGIIGYYGGNRTILPIVTAQDVQSLTRDPLLANPGGTAAADYIPTTSTLLATPGTGITTDYDGGAARSTTYPAMGAFEIAIIRIVDVFESGDLKGGFSSLKGAFDAINDGTIKTGNFEIKINANTSENGTAVLYQSGYSGLSDYSSILIYPTVSGLAVSGTVTAPLISLDGADNVTIDGRVNATGSAKDLIITNLSTSAVAGTSTISLINDATSNTVKYCTIKGSSTNASSGVIMFSTTTGTTGNDGNTFDNNNITSSTDANRPLNAIYSAGTATFDNDGNNITNNSFYDFLSRATASNGINLAANTTAWTITGNSFYETASFAPTASVAYNVILINNASGTNFVITGNFIGGQAASCGGSAWTKTVAFNNTFTGINITAGTGTATSVQNNTIRNFNWSNSTTATWTAIAAAAGDVNIRNSYRKHNRSSDRNRINYIYRHH